eukprot:31054-Pelagococcus_subviridis.AAC.5
MPCIVRKIPRLTSNAVGSLVASSHRCAAPRCEKHIRRSFAGRMYSFALTPSASGFRTPRDRSSNRGDGIVGGRLGSRVGGACAKGRNVSYSASINTRSIFSRQTARATTGSLPKSWTVTRSMHCETCARRAPYAAAVARVAWWSS